MAWKPDYITDDQLKEEDGVDDALDDAAIARAITSASRAVDRSTRRQFGIVPAPVARFYTARWSSVRGRWIVFIDDLMTTEGLAVAVDITEDSTYAGVITGARLTPLNAAADEMPWTELDIPATSTVQPDCTSWGVRVTARWGWTDVPVTVQQATMLQAKRFLSRKNSPYGIAGSPADGSELRLLARVDPDVAVMLDGYRRNRAAERAA
jgi:hypothetical protein